MQYPQLFIGPYLLCLVLLALTFARCKVANGMLSLGICSGSYYFIRNSDGLLVISIPIAVGCLLLVWWLYRRRPFLPSLPLTLDDWVIFLARLCGLQK